MARRGGCEDCGELKGRLGQSITHCDAKDDSGQRKWLVKGQDNCGKGGGAAGFRECAG